MRVCARLNQKEILLCKIQARRLKIGLKHELPMEIAMSWLLAMRILEN